MRSEIGVNMGAFSERVKAYLRTSGYSQSELADALGIHPKVLSRKLHGNGNARLTHLEIQRVITILAGWYAITTQDEVLQLLEVAEVAPNIFRDDEWQAPPLSTLATRRAQPISSDDSRSAAPQHNLPSPTTRLVGRCSSGECE